MEIKDIDEKKEKNYKLDNYIISSMKTLDFFKNPALDLTPLMKTSEILRNSLYEINLSRIDYQSLGQSFIKAYNKDIFDGLYSVTNVLNEYEKKYSYKKMIENISVSGKALSSILKDTNDILLSKDSFDKLYKKTNTIKSTIDDSKNYKKIKYNSYLKLDLKLNTDIVKSIYNFTNEKVVLPEKLEKDNVNKEVLYAFKDNEIDVDKAYKKSIAGKLHESSITLIKTMKNTNDYYARLNDGKSLIVDAMELCGEIVNSIEDEKEFVDFITVLYKKIYDAPCESGQNIIYVYCKEKSIDTTILDTIKHVRQTYQHDGEKVNEKYLEERDRLFRNITNKIVALKASDWKMIKKKIIDDLIEMFNEINNCLSEDINNN